MIEDISNNINQTAYGTHKFKGETKITLTDKQFSI